MAEELTIPCPFPRPRSSIGGQMMTACPLCGEINSSTVLTNHRPIVVRRLVERLSGVRDYDLVVAERDGLKTALKAESESRRDFMKAATKFGEVIEDLKAKVEHLEGELSALGCANQDLEGEYHDAQDARSALAAERDLLREALVDAVAVLGAEEMQYDEWTRVLGVMRDALDAAADVVPKPALSRLQVEAQNLRHTLADIAFLVAPNDAPTEVIEVDDIPALVHAVVEHRKRLRAALIRGNQMMGSMKGADYPPTEDLWDSFELALADLVNDGLLDVGEGT